MFIVLKDKWFTFAHEIYILANHHTISIHRNIIISIKALSWPNVLYYWLRSNGLCAWFCLYTHLFIVGNFSPWFFFNTFSRRPLSFVTSIDFARQTMNRLIQVIFSPCTKYNATREDFVTMFTLLSRREKMTIDYWGKQIVLYYTIIYCTVNYV